MECFNEIFGNNLSVICLVLKFDLRGSLQLINDVSGRGEELVFITPDPDRFTASSDEAQDQGELEGGRHRFWLRIWNCYVCIEPVFAYLPSLRKQRQLWQGNITMSCRHVLSQLLLIAINMHPQKFALININLKP